MNEPNECSRLFGAVNDPLLCAWAFILNVLHYSPVPNNGDSFERWEPSQVTHVHMSLFPFYCTAFERAEMSYTLLCTKKSARQAIIHLGKKK